LAVLQFALVGLFHEYSVTPPACAVPVWSAPSAEVAARVNVVILRRRRWFDFDISLPLLIGF
jgi:hypothetical protein